MTEIASPFLHFHIPKTAGTSLRATFMREFGPDQVAYMMPDRRMVRCNELPFEPEQLDTARIVARKLGILDVFSSAVREYN